MSEPPDGGDGDDFDDDFLVFVDDDDEWGACWSVLGIEETQDTKVIRRAYADKLREMGRGRKADAFQRLRRAYENALSEAEWSAQADAWDDEDEEDEQDEEDEEDGSDDDPWIGNGKEDDVESGDIDKAQPEAVVAPKPETGRNPGDNSDHSPEEFPDDDPDAAPEDEFDGDDDPDDDPDDNDDSDRLFLDDGRLSAADVLIEEARRVFENSTERWKAGTWLEMLDHEQLGSLDSRSDAGDQLFHFFYDEVVQGGRAAAKLKDIPPEVWARFDTLFAWSENELDFALIYGDEEVDTIMRQVHKARGRSVADSGSSSEWETERDRYEISPASKKSSISDWVVGIILWVVLVGILRFVVGLFD